MTNTASTDGFIGKWHARWPEWNIVATFVPVGQRELAFAWFALLDEFTDAAWAGDDAAPGLAKLAWWQQELQGWSKGARRHPLGEVLQKQPVPWTMLASSLNRLPATREQGVDRGTQVIELRPMATAISDCEWALFGGASRRDDVEAILEDLLAARLLLAGDDGEAAHAQRPPGGLQASTRPRRLQAMLLECRLEALHRGQGARPVSAWRLLWRAWRAARRG